MTLLICCQHYYPEMVSTGQTMTELATKLSKRGMKVTVYCGQPTVIARDKIPKVVYHEGVRVCRLWGTRFAKRFLWGRVINGLTFMVSVMGALFKIPVGSEVMVLTNPPFLVGCVGLVSWVKRFRVTVLHFDLYPETPIVLGLLSKTGIVAKLWRRWNAIGFKQAQHLVVLGECMASVLSGSLSVVDQKKITMIPIWANSDLLGQPGNPQVFREKWGLGDDFVVLYSGNMGRFHDMTTLVEASQLLDDRVKMLFVGHGHKRPYVEKHCKVYDHVPTDHLPDLLACASVGIVTLMPDQVGLSVPSKAVGLLSAGVPVIAVMPEHSQIARWIIDYDCGWVVPNGDPEQLARLINAIAKDPECMMQKKQQAKRLHQDVLHLDRVVDQYVEILGL